MVDKRDLLARILLSNQSGIEDIPPTTSSATLIYLPLPKLTNKEIIKATLEAGSTMP